MLDARQIRAARALLDWSREDLANFSGMSVPALARVELGDAQARPASMDKIQSTFEGAGVVFIEGSGVRLRNEIVRVQKGPDALILLFNEIYEYAIKNKSKTELLCSGFKAADFFAHISKDFIKLHSERMAALKGVFFKTLVSEAEEDYYSVTYSEYRKLPDEMFQGVPFYIFGDRLAIIAFNEQLQVILIEEKNVAEVYRQQFNALWAQAKK
jgi:transcriptional regulator with XRE-family HTH domain